MGDLEDAFFKQNVPGQYTKWSTESDAPVSSDSDSEDDDYYFQDAPSLPISTSTAAPTAAALTANKAGNTGVKAVISDYLDTKRDEELEAATERLERMELWNSVVHNSNLAGRGVDTTVNTITTQIRSQDENDDSDDEFLRHFRSERLQQQQQHNNNRPNYGTYSKVSPEEYVDLVDTIHPESHAVVHLYESTIKESVMLHSSLEKLAQIMDHVKFIEVEAMDAKPDLDLICLPVVLVYKGGQLVCSAVRFTDGLVDERGGGASLNVEDVREKLEDLGVVPKELGK